MEKMQQVLVVLAVLAIFAISAQAQCNFASSCSSISHSGSIMSASCNPVSGGPKSTNIDLNNCVSNNNGNLVCGSLFTRSCSGITYTDTTVFATCRNTAGQQVSTQLNLNRCVSNNNGNLQCCRGRRKLM